MTSLSMIGVPEASLPKMNLAVAVNISYFSLLYIPNPVTLISLLVMNEIPSTEDP